MAAKLVSLIGLSTLLVLAGSFGPSPVNALSVGTSPNHHARALGHHALLAKKKRADSRRCKPRPSSSAAPASTPAADKSNNTPKPSPPVAPPPPAPKPSQSSKPAPPPAPPAPPPPPPANGPGGGKVGLAWANGDDGTLKNFVTPKVKGIYSWSPWKPAKSDELGLDFAPMLWGPKQIGDFTKLVKPGYARWALGFNEPDIAGQSNLDPGYAASLWKQYLQPLKGQGYNLVSPAVTSGPGGKVWLKNFMNACSGCSVDAIAVHWYGTNPQEFINYVQDFHSTFGRDIWVTEFACQNFAGGAQANADQVNNFMNTVTAWMDGTGYVSRYFAFGVMHDMQGVNPLNQLMAGNGQPTPLGWSYLT